MSLSIIHQEEETKFPGGIIDVYDKLLTSPIDNDVDWGKICATLNTLSTEHTNYLCAILFRHYQLEMKNKSNNTALEQLLIQYQAEVGNRVALNLPYGGQTFKTGKGVVYTVNNLPPEIKKIVVNYVKSISS